MTRLFPVASLLYQAQPLQGRSSVKKGPASNVYSIGQAKSAPPALKPSTPSRIQPVALQQNSQVSVNDFLAGLIRDEASGSCYFSPAAIQDGQILRTDKKVLLTRDTALLFRETSLLIAAAAEKICGEKKSKSADLLRERVSVHGTRWSLAYEPGVQEWSGVSEIKGWGEASGIIQKPGVVSLYPAPKDPYWIQLAFRPENILEIGFIYTQGLYDSSFEHVIQVTPHGDISSQYYFLLNGVPAGNKSDSPFGRVVSQLNAKDSQSLVKGVVNTIQKSGQYTKRQVPHEEVPVRPGYFVSKSNSNIESLLDDGDQDGSQSLHAYSPSKEKPAFVVNYEVTMEEGVEPYPQLGVQLYSSSRQGKPAPLARDLSELLFSAIQKKQSKGSPKRK